MIENLWYGIMVNGERYFNYVYKADARFWYSENECQMNEF